MTRKKRARPMAPAERREQLLHIARDILASDGLAGLTMEKLAARADLSKPVAYSVFDSRQDVAIALLEEHFQIITAAFEQRVASALTLDTYITAVIEGAFSFSSVSKNSIDKLTNGFSAGDAINQLYLKEEARFRKHWEKLLQLMSTPAGLIPAGAMILSGMVGNAVKASIAGEEASAMEALKLMMMAGLDALVRGPAPTLSPTVFEAPVYDLIRGLQGPGEEESHDGEGSARSS